MEFYSKNKFEKLVHLVGFIIRVYILIRVTQSLLPHKLSLQLVNSRHHTAATAPLRLNYDPPSWFHTIPPVGSLRSPGWFLTIAQLVRYDPPVGSFRSLSWFLTIPPVGSSEMLRCSAVGPQDLECFSRQCKSLNHGNLPFCLLRRRWFSAWVFFLFLINLFITGMASPAPRPNPRRVGPRYLATRWQAVRHRWPYHQLAYHWKCWLGDPNVSFLPESRTGRCDQKSAKGAIHSQSNWAILLC